MEIILDKKYYTGNYTGYNYVGCKFVSVFFLLERITSGCKLQKTKLNKGR